MEGHLKSTNKLTVRSKGEQNGQSIMNVLHQTIKTFCQIREFTFKIFTLGLKIQTRQLQDYKVTLLILCKKTFLPYDESGWLECYEIVQLMIIDYVYKQQSEYSNWFGR